VSFASQSITDVEIRFPSKAEIAADTVVEAQRAADWTAASGVNGDHNERGGWIYLDTSNGQYSVHSWPVGDFFSVGPDISPADDHDPCTILPDSSTKYCVGNYHLHATLRDQDDIDNALAFPVGPSDPDKIFANYYRSPGL